MSAWPGEIAARRACRDNPDLWTSIDATDRILAAQTCTTCPALNWCATDARNDPPDAGVMAGRDYTRTKTGQPKQARPCGYCGRPVAGTRRRRYCNDKCGDLARRGAA